MADEDQYKAEIVQVFDDCKMPYIFGDEELPLLITSGQGIHLDNYCRWYPKKAENPKEVGGMCFFKDEKQQQAGKELNKWLLDHGMEWDKNNEYFYVLIYIS